jgi:hypothetical protein
MSSESNFNAQPAHRHFSVQCFNQAWDLINKPERTAEEDEEMLRLGMASLWHWTQRPDCTVVHRSIGLWQVARIYALIGQPHNAERYGQMCLDAASGEDVEPFYKAYAYEALARAALGLRDPAGVQKYLEEARRLADQVTHPEDQQVLRKDLESIQLPEK